MVRLLGIVVVAVILAKVDIGSIGATLKRTHLPLLFLGILVNLIVVFVQSLRWRYVVVAQGMKIRTSEAVLVNFVGFALAFLTPARVGDVVRGFYLVDHGYPYIKSFLSVIYERILDVGAITVFGLLGLHFVGGLFGDYETQFVLLLVGVPLAMFGLWRVQAIRRTGYSMLKRLFPGKSKVGLQTMVAELRLFTMKRNFTLVLYTLVFWGGYFLKGWVLVRTLGIPIGYLQISGVTAMNALLAMLPITFAGIGTREAVFVYGFWKLGYSAEEAIAFSVLFLGTQLLSVITGYVVWVTRPGLIRVGRARQTAL